MPAPTAWYPGDMARAGESAQERSRRARQKSEQLARYAERWEKGAIGECQTASALSRLGPEWTAWHDLRWPGRRYANIDHVAVGPGGIFVIDSKNWSGDISVRGGVLRQNGYRREREVAGCADSALAVGELIPGYLDRVRPVMCFTNGQQIDGWARDVMLCSSANISTMLSTRPPILNAGEVAEAVVLLEARMRSMTAAEPTPPDRSATSGHRHRAGPLPAAGIDARSTGSSRSRAARQTFGVLLKVFLLIVALLLVVGFVSNIGRILVGVAQAGEPSTRSHVS